ncbi:MAG: hypothetical protein ACJAWV_000391 [Flammeovirgaceae bacterium]|jgi:hypothetical protein
MKILSKFFFFLLFINVVSCQSQYEDNKQQYKGGGDSDTKIEEDANTGVTERKLMKEGYVEFRTGDLESVKNQISQGVKKYKAYISSDQIYKAPNRISNTVVIRVPSQKFDSLLNEIISGVETVDSKEIKVKDVTEEFLDVEARLKTKKELETRYLALLKKANTISEILEIEKQIEALRSEIESTEGRLKYLESRVSFATLTLTFYEQTNTETTFSYEFKQAFRNGWQNLIWFLVNLTNLWPFLILLPLVVMGIKAFRRKKK